MRRFLLCLGVLACWFLPATTRAQVPMENRYLVYRVAEPIQVSAGVLLADQFGVHSEDALTLEWFGTPVQKDQEPIFDPALHHTWWRIDNPQPVRNVLVDNQFGPQSLTVRNGRYLLTPALKNVPGGQPPHANHYECYEADGPRADRPVVLTDQFGTYSAIVREPVWFCNPVEKTHDGVTYPPVDSQIHLTCYRLDPLEPVNQTVTTVDQFGFWTLALVDAQWLCVPTIKFETVPAERASWGQVKARYR